MRAATHREYLALVVPFVLTSITAPLLGIVDTAVMGRMDDPSYIGGVAVGALIFSTIYWLFGFLRFTTTGFTAQAHGRGDGEEILWAVARPLAIAVAAGCALILLQRPIFVGILAIVRPEESVVTFAGQYFHILIWGAPFTLAGYALVGWLMGMTYVRPNLYIQIFTNVLNLVLVVLFVLVFRWGVRGVAFATLIAQILSCALSAALVYRYGRFELSHVTLRRLFDRTAFRRIMAVNNDVLIRTVCILVMTNLFTASGASFGTETLAANSILFQLQYFMGYLLDGFANASSVLAGEALGRNDPTLYRRDLRLSWIWIAASIAALTLLHWLWDVRVIRMLTKLDTVAEIAIRHSPWLLLYPLTYGFNTVIYGIYNGLTWGAPIRNASVLALVLFLVALQLFVPVRGNDGLWLAFTLFNVGRSGYLLATVKTSLRIFDRRPG